MMNFFKKIFGKNNEQGGLQGNVLKLYFDRNKIKFLEIQLNNDYSLYDIFEHNKEEILKRLQENVLIQKNDYCFVLIDDDSPLTELKLKLIDSPYKFLKRRTNLYYLNINEKEKESDNGKPFPDGLKKNIYCEDCIREGEILKYSKKIQKFKKKTMILNKEKLILQDNKSKKSNIISLIDIRTVRHITFHKEKYPFEIETYDYEKYIFASKALSDQESWIEAIISQKTLIFDNKCINDYSFSISKISRDIYEKEKKVSDICFSLKELISLSETRAVVLEYINDKLLVYLLNNFFQYISNIKKYKYLNAKENAINIINLVMNNEKHYEEIIRKEQEEAKDIEMKLRDQPINSLRKGSDNSIASFKISSKNNIKERITLYENMNNKRLDLNNLSQTRVELKLNEKISQFANKRKTCVVLSHNELPCNKKRASEDGGPYSTSKLPEYHSSTLDINNVSENNLSFVNDENNNSRRISNQEDSNNNDHNISSNTIKLSELSLKRLERNDQLTLKQKLYLFCSLNSYKILKNVRTCLEKIENESLKLNIGEASLTSSFISLKSNNSDSRGFNEFLKIDIFDEIFENILKYIHKFYYKDLKSSNFKQKLQEIFLFLWKKRSKFDFEDLLSLELPKKYPQNVTEFDKSKSLYLTITSETNSNSMIIKTPRTDKKVSFDDIMSNIDNERKTTLSNINNYNTSKK